MPKILYSIRGNIFLFIGAMSGVDKKGNAAKAPRKSCIKRGVGVENMRCLTAEDRHQFGNGEGICRTVTAVFGFDNGNAQRANSRCEQTAAGKTNRRFKTASVDLG